MYGKLAFFVLLDVVILAYSEPGRFYHEYYTTHEKNSWSGDWGQDWWQTTRPARRRTTTPRVETQSTPATTLPQPTIRDVEIRVGEATTADSTTPSPRPITFIQEDLKEKDKTPQFVLDSGPNLNSDSFPTGLTDNSEIKLSIQKETSVLNDDGKVPGLENNANTFGIAIISNADAIEAAQNSDTKLSIQKETSVLNDDGKVPGPENNANTFGITVITDADAIEAVQNSDSKIEESFTENQDNKPQAITGPKETQIAVISSIDAADSEVKPGKRPLIEFEPVSEEVSNNYFANINRVLEEIQGTSNGKVEDYEAPLLDEKASMWHVAVYEKKKGRYEHICGGSLIKADIVISAGHCFWSPVGQALPTTQFRVAAGKLYPRYDDPRETAAQYSQIRNISITDMKEPCMQPDLAVVNLVTPFRYTSAVKPVCFSQDQGLKNRQLKEGNVATVASWSTVENGACRPSRHSWLSLSFVQNHVCQHETLYKTSGTDRICAGEINNMTECPADSGTGLVFYRDATPFLRGVATALPLHGDCARFRTRSFSNIIDHIGILRKYFKAITDVYNLGECEALYNNTIVGDGNSGQNDTGSRFGDGFVQIDPPAPDEQTFTAQGIGSKPVPRQPGTSAPALQWHVGVYSKRWQPYMQLCGGSLIKRDFAISAAHCFWDDEAGLEPASQFAVAGGKLFRPWNDTQDTYAQHSDISEIIVPVRFRGAATSFQDDIAVLKLSTPFTYAPGVQSACVDFRRHFELAQLRPGNMATILGWGLTQQNGSPSQRLTYLELPYVDVEDCFADSEPSFLKYITSDKICAGDSVTGKALCRGDSGGGLILYSSSTPYLHGVASTAAGNQHQCNAFAIAAFTSLYPHRAFLRDNIPAIEKECVRPETTEDRGTPERVENMGGSSERVENVGGAPGRLENVGVVTSTGAPLYTNVPYFPYPNHFVCNCNCKP